MKEKPDNNKKPTVRFKTNCRFLVLKTAKICLNDKKIEKKQKKIQKRDLQIKKNEL